MQVKTVIVDDEQPICDEVEYLLKDHSDVEVAATFNNSQQAFVYISQNHCDLVFLDIQMPGMSGLELAQQLGMLRTPPLVVFLTAFQEHALEAFNTPAVGYITKPITEEKLAKVLAKVRHLLLGREQPEKVPVNKICVTHNGKLIPLDKTDIVLAYVKDKDVFVRTKNAEFTAALTLQELESLLGEQQFMRVHRQYIVNLDKITEIIPWFHGSYLLRMGDFKTEEVPVSRNKVRFLKSAMGIK